MHFCPLCGTRLLAEQPQQIQLCCPACPYVYRITTSLSSIVPRAVKHPASVLGGKDELKYANKCTIDCPKCSNTEALFMELQTRSADEPMTIFYRCTVCRHNWKD